MASVKNLVQRVLGVVLPLAAGGALIVLSASLKSPPDAKPAAENRQPVRVITLAEIDLVPRVLGYGAVTPARQWRAIARVEGEITWTSDKLANGYIVEAGTELLKIDDSDIRLSLAQIDAQIAALDVKDETVRASLTVNRETLTLARAEVARARELATRSVVSKATLEQAERQEVTARAALVTLENQLALNDSERSVLKAQRDIAERSLDHVAIRAPFAMRIGEVSAEAGQYVSRGQTLLSGDGIDAAEISAQFPIGRLSPLVHGRGGENGSAGPLGLAATVRLRSPVRVIEWQATVDRVGDTIDPRTQSATVVVRVDNPQAQAKPGERPPLRRNMFVEVELSAPAAKALVIPASAVRNGEAMIVDTDGRLATRQVDIAYSIGRLAVIGKGLVAGEKLVVSEPALAVTGLAVKPQEDKRLLAELVAEAANGNANP